MLQGSYLGGMGGGRQMGGGAAASSWSIVNANDLGGTILSYL